MKRNNAGISLIEALITMLVISFAFLGLMKFQGTLQANQTISRSRTEAQLQAKDILEKIQASATPASFGSASDTVKGTNVKFNRSWTVQATGPTETTAVVTVGWVDSRGATGTTAVSTVVVKNIATNEAVLVASSGPGGSTNTNPPW